MLIFLVCIFYSGSEVLAEDNITNITIYSDNSTTYENFTLENATSALSYPINIVNSNINKLEEMNENEKSSPLLPYKLSFISEDFEPTEKIDSKIMLLINSTNLTQNYTYGFIMINGLTSQEELDDLSNLNVDILGYHSFHSYKAKIPISYVQNISNLSFVKWIGYSTYKQKVNPNLYDKITIDGDNITVNESVENETIHVFINLFENDSSEEFKGTLESEGVVLLNYSDDLKFYYAELTPLILKNVIQYPFVLHVESSGDAMLLHDESIANVGGDYIRNQYGGNGSVVGIIDTGYSSTHRDLPDPTICADFSGDGLCIDFSGHGSHVAGTIFGRGDSDQRYKGVAPNVSDIVIAKVENAIGHIEPVNIILATDWMRWGPDQKPDVVSISVGVDYSSNCIGTDDYSRQADLNAYYDNQILVTAAGNCGYGGLLSCNNLGNKSIVSPACAKNVITVGATYDYYPLVDSIDNASSIGPTWDGRKKPDVVAPGCAITSLNSSNSVGYTTDCGTSFAAPHVSGVISTLLEHYPSVYRGQPERVKAILSANAVSKYGVSKLSDVYGTGKVESYLLHWNSPLSLNRGWLAGSSESFNVTTGTDSYYYFDINVTSSVKELIIVLNYVEPPASSGASQAVIHNLDLWVDKDANETSGDSGEWNSSSIIDNKEIIIIDNPSFGTYRLKAYAKNIVSGVGVPRASIAYIMYGSYTTGPSWSLNPQISSNHVKVGDNVTASIRVETLGGPTTSGHYARIDTNQSIGGVNFLQAQTTREDGVIMKYNFSGGNENKLVYTLGDVHEGDSRMIIWTFNVTSPGPIAVNLSSKHSNSAGGPLSWVFYIDADKADGDYCNSSSQCYSGYCDNDGVGLVDDNWCFTPYNSYFDNQEPLYCERSTGQGINDCDERTVGEHLNKCVGTSYYEERCSLICGYEDITTRFECGESGCSCLQPLCDGLTNGDGINTCNAGQSYFADECTFSANGQDRNDSICRSSNFASGCSASLECNGVVAGTNNCNSNCQFIPPTLNISNLSVLDTYGLNSLGKTFEFKINNVNNSQLSDIIWNLNTGENNITSIYNISLNTNGSTYIYLDYNYTSPGNYTVIATTTVGGVSDSETINIEV